jgi:hypothetical protein
MVSVARVIMVFTIVLYSTLSSFAQERCDGVVIRQQTAPRARPGQEILFQISIHHSGHCQISDMEIIDYLPQDAEWLSSDPEPDEAPTDGRESDSPLPVSRLKWKNRGLSPGSTWETRVRIRVPEMKTGWMRNTLCLTASNMNRKCSDIETFVRRD